MKVEDIVFHLDEIAPFDTAEEWDNCGLLVGSYDQEVKKVYIALDVTGAVIDDALSFGADLVITHHPLIFKPVKDILNDTVLYKAVASGMSFVASHTCLDKAVGGVNHQLAERVGIKKLEASEYDAFLKIGEIDEPCSAEAFANRLKATLGGAVSYTDSGKQIKTVALCSGAGGEFVALAKSIGADAFLTGEAKHHEYLLADELGISIFAAGHFETENMACEYLAKSIKSRFGDRVEIKVSALKNLLKNI